MPQIGFNSIMCYYRGDIFILQFPQIENLGNFGLKILGILHLNIQSTVSQVPMDFILFIAYLFSEWHIVPQLCIQIKQSRSRSRKALYG